MNTKSIKRYLPLSAEVSMSKNHSIPDDGWTTLDDNNSPIHNDALCPLFYTEKKTDSPSVTDRYGNTFYVKDGNYLCKNDDVIDIINDEKFVKVGTGIRDELAEYYNGHIYHGAQVGKSIVIYKDDAVFNTITLDGNEKIITQRLWHGIYFAMTGINRNLYFRGWNARKDMTSVYNSLPWEQGQRYSSPKITVAEQNNGYTVACIILKTGVALNARNVWPIFVHYDGTTVRDPYFKVAFSTSGQIPISATTYENVTKYDEHTTVMTSQQTKSCTKDDLTGEYIDDITEQPITFTEGYTPRLVSGNSYTYTLFTTTYIYDVYIYKNAIDSGQWNDTSATFHGKVYVKRPAFPVTQNEYSLSFTTVGKYVASASVTIENNLGFILDQGMINSEDIYFDFTHRTNSQTADTRTERHYVPLSAMSISGWTGYNRTGTQASFIWTYDSSETVQTPNYFTAKGVMLDDGYFYAIDNHAPLYAVDAFKGYNFKCRMNITGSHDFNCVVAGVYNRGNTTGTHIFGACVDVGYNNLRQTLFFRKSGDDVKPNINSAHPVMYDSVSDEMVDYCGLTFTTTTLNPTGDLKTFYNKAGTKVNKKDSFVPLYNNGYISGISYNSTLLTSWLSIDTEVPFYCDDDVAFYRDQTTKEWIKITKENGIDMWLVENRFVVINTTSFRNCYDTKTNKIDHYASDWNDRIFLANRVGDNTCVEIWVHASAHNANFDIANQDSAICSAIWSGYAQQWSGTSKFAPCDEDLEIETYLKNDGSVGVPHYFETYFNISKGWYYTNAGTKVDSDLSYYNAAYPLYDSKYMMKNPSLFAKFVNSGNNQDYMIDDNIGYQVLYEGVEPVLLSAATGDIYGMTSVFVIQSMPYAMINGKIYALTYLNGTFTGMDCIIDVTGMQYIGSVPTKAFFFSPNNRAIYCFFGDANLTKVKDASAIENIYYVTNNPATQTVYMATNDGLYMITDNSSYKQTFYDVQSITFCDDGTSVITHKIDGKYVATRFWYEDAEGRTTNQVRFDTGLKGAGEHRVFTIDKYNITLFSDQRRNGKIKLTSYILDDVGTIQKENITKEIRSTDWDKDFYCKQIDFTPVKNKGVGIGLSIVSDFAINNITASATVDNNTQSASSGFHI